MKVRDTVAAGRVLVLFAALLLGGCESKNTVNAGLASEMPSKIVWAWERPEDLRFLDPQQFGVAFLAETIYLEQDRVTPRLRRQPLEISPGTYVIAVTRIETNKDGKKRPTFDDAMVASTVSLIKNTLDLPDVKAIQIDFDAVLSERGFYRDLMTQLRPAIPADKPLTMTSLASWCTGDAWFNAFPVDEAVPMAFEMGADGEKIKAYLKNGNDWREPLCRGSYGISVDDPIDFALKPGRRTYYFKNSAWTTGDIGSLK